MLKNCINIQTLCLNIYKRILHSIKNRYLNAGMKRVHVEKSKCLFLYTFIKIYTNVEINNSHSLVLSKIVYSMLGRDNVFNYIQYI